MPDARTCDLATTLAAHPSVSCNKVRLTHLGQTEKYASLAKGTVTIWETSDNLAVACSLTEMNYRPLEAGT